MLIHGKCHCGNIAFSLVWEPDPIEIPARACTCSFCTRHGGAWTSNPNGALEIVIKESSLVSRYTFGTKTAEFLICVRCGVVPLVTSRVDGHLYAVVNVNTFEDVDQLLLSHAPVNVDGEGEASRLARRKRNWIANVRYIETGS
ncbi:MAG: GFA family protein [Gammaproteobacteria bacterium]